MMYHAISPRLNGLGTWVCDDMIPPNCYDDGVEAPTFPSTQPTVSTGPVIPLNQGGGAAALSQLGISSGQPVSGNPSSGFNWGILSPLFGAAGAIGSGFAASELKPGQSMATQGTVITGAGQSLPGSTISGGLNLSGLTMPLLIGGGLLVLVMAMRGRGK